MNFDEFMGYAVPTVLILIVVGYLYVKLLKPYVLPLLGDIFGRVSGASIPMPTPRREISYE